MAMGYNEKIDDSDSMYDSTPLFVLLRLMLVLAIARGWKMRFGDVSTAFLHAPITSLSTYIWPPKKYYPNGTTLRKLKKAMYGLDLVPKHGRIISPRPCRNWDYDVSFLR